jgi:hypothetical protein
MSDPKARLVDAAAEFAAEFSARPHPKLLGVTDGKAVGTYIETEIKLALHAAGIIDPNEGNAAKGIDLPTFGVDIKVTSTRKPQSSSPFVSFRQKIEGLGYDLLLFVYEKLDEAAECNVTFKAVRYIPAPLTGDFQTTQGLRRLIEEDGANADDVFAFLIEKHIPADEASLYEYAEELLQSAPAQGYLTITHAPQWRLQYSRFVDGGIDGVLEIV